MNVRCGWCDEEWQAHGVVPPLRWALSMAHGISLMKHQFKDKNFKNEEFQDGGSRDQIKPWVLPGMGSGETDQVHQAGPVPRALLNFYR